MSSQIVSIAQNAASLTAGKQYGEYSKVILHVTDELAYTVGNDTGMTMELTMPFGSREMAQNILKDLAGYQYQSFDAADALLDPAVQLGDALDVNGIYGGIYSMRSKLGKLYAADVGAPEVKQIDQAFKFKSSRDRKVARDFLSVYANLSIHADQIRAEVEERKSAVEKLNAALNVQAGKIDAKVEKSGGDRGSFSWEMEYDHFAFFSNNSVLFRLAKGVAELTGKIVATSGKIGGFDILSNRLSYNNMDWGGTNTTGIYIGPRGIQCGKNCQIDSNGNIYAENGTFRGNVSAGNIQYGGNYGTMSGSGITGHSISGGRLEYGTVSTSYTSGGINASLANADFAADIVRGLQNFGALKGNTLLVNTLYFDGKYLERRTIDYKMANGENGRMQVICWKS